MSATQPSFATFWAGRVVSPYEAACITSFLARGYQYVVYSYDQVHNLPDGAVLRDAREITAPDNAERFFIKGKANLSHFSDLFRYELFHLTSHVWVDTDMLMLRPLELPGYGRLIAREDQTVLCGAIMRLDSHDPNLTTLIACTEAMRDRDLVWGATGPRLLTKVFGRRATFGKILRSEILFSCALRPILEGIFARVP